MKSIYTVSKSLYTMKPVKYCGDQGTNPAGLSDSVNFKDRDSLYNEEIFKELTGIKNNCYMHSVGTPMYDLQGRRVENPKQGEIYIQNGKKVKK